MKRELAALEAGVHDLLVIGAGIYGACIARDAAQRGLKVALIDRGDVGCATSHNSFKIMHGGLRYLQHLDLPRLLQSAREQRRWLRVAPHLARPLPFVMPTLGHGTRGPEAMRGALALHALLARAGAAPARGPKLPRGRILSPAECMEHIPGLATDRLTGGALWHEVQLVHADRVLLECVQDAVAHGAVIATYVAAEGLLGTPAVVEGARARDLEGGATFDIRARLTISACGPAPPALLRRTPAAAAGFGGVAKALNLVTRHPLLDTHAIAVSSRERSDSLVPRADGRLYFVTPWQGRTVIGTSHLPCRPEADPGAFEEAEIEAFVAEINEAWPAAQLHREDVLYCYAGLTPVESDRGPPQVRLRRRGCVVDHARRHGVRGLLSVQGIKYTTARLVAEGVIDLALARLGRKAPPCRSASTPLPGAVGYTSLHDLEGAATAAGMAECAECGRLLQAHGTAWREVLAAADGPLRTDDDLFRCRVRHAVRHEMAVRLEDVLLRRLEHATQGLLSPARLVGAAAIMAEELGWSSARRAREQDALAALLQRHRGGAVPGSAPLSSEGDHHAA